MNEVIQQQLSESLCGIALALRVALDQTESDDDPVNIVTSYAKAKALMDAIDAMDAERKGER